MIENWVFEQLELVRRAEEGLEEEKKEVITTRSHKPNEEMTVKQALAIEELRTHYAQELLDLPPSELVEFLMDRTPTSEIVEEKLDFLQGLLGEERLGMDLE